MFFLLIIRHFFFNLFLFVGKEQSLKEVSSLLNASLNENSLFCFVFCFLFLFLIFLYNADLTTLLLLQFYSRRKPSEGE